MSDVPMTAEAAPATDNPLPTVTDETVQLPSPVSTEATPEEKAEAAAAAKAEADKSAKKLTVRETLEAAAAKVEKDDKAADPKAESKPKADEPQPRENGKFASREKPVDPATAKPATDAPARFVPEAKAAWATTPDPVKAEVHRTIKNLEAGIEEHTRRYAEIKEYDDLAKATGTTLPAAMKQYVAIDKMLGENFPAAISRIFQNRGVDMRAFAADVLQLPADARQALRIGASQQQAQPVNPEVLALRQEVAGLKQQLGGVTDTIGQQRTQTIEAELAEFSADKPLFNELSNEIASYITNDGLSYQEAYDRAVADFEAKAARAGFIARQAPAPVQNPAGQPSAGSRSIKGAPGPGSSPATRKPSNSIREALVRAAGIAG